MVSYCVRRLIAFLLIMVAASAVIFTLIEILPGDPALTMLGYNATPETLAALRTELNLDVVGFRRYLGWLGGMLSGDFGISYTYRIPVSSIILERIAITLPLAAMALFLTVSLAIPLGVLAAARKDQWLGHVIIAASRAGIAVPNFWFALLLIGVFAGQFGWFPAGGFNGWHQGVVSGLTALILPAIALALPQTAILLKVTRGAMLTVAGQDYIRTARAKGLGLDQALWRHGLRGALIPVVTIMGMQFSFLFAGAIIIENVFALPGLGRLVFQAISQRDLIMVESSILLIVFVVAVMAFVVDILYAVIDPRLRGRNR